MKDRFGALALDALPQLFDLRRRARHARKRKAYAMRGDAIAGYGIVASGQVTSAAIALPLSIGGAVLGSAAAVSAGAGALAMTAATAPIGQPLPVSDRVVTTLPPNKALKNDRVNQ